MLCAYANFRTSYKRIDGISYTIYPGEWIMSVEELSRYFRTRFRRQTLAALEGLQKKGFTGLLCDAYNTTDIGDSDCTRVSVMDKERFQGWLSDRENRLRSISDL